MRATGDEGDAHREDRGGPEPVPRAAYSEDPARFEEEIRAYEQADRAVLPPVGAIVCIGSSSLRGWQETIADDLAPLPVIARGFGGSTMNDALHYADRMILRYRPRAVVLYEGDNDLGSGVPPEAILEALRRLVARIHRTLPAARVYALSIKPSPSRWALWPRMKAANRLIEACCSGDARLHYVDVASVLLDASGMPAKDLFQEDGLHLTRAGYVLWRERLRPILMRHELPGTPRNPPS